MIERILALHAKGEDLSWRNVSTGWIPRWRPAALHAGRFASWSDALQTAGLDPTHIARYRRWTITLLREELFAPRGKRGAAGSQAHVRTRICVAGGRVSRRRGIAHGTPAPSDPSTPGAQCAAHSLSWQNDAGRSCSQVLSAHLHELDHEDGCALPQTHSLFTACAPGLL